MADVLQRKLQEVIADGNLRNAFDEFDLDGNGTLEPNEIEVLMDSLKVPKVHDDREMLMLEMDLNGDGVIDYGEFEAWMGKRDTMVDKNVDYKLVRMWNLAQHLGKKRRAVVRKSKRDAIAAARDGRDRKAELAKQEAWVLRWRDSSLLSARVR